MNSSSDPAFLSVFLLWLLHSTLIEGALSVAAAERDDGVDAECAGDYVDEVLDDAQEDWEAEVAGRERAELDPSVEGARTQDREDEPEQAQDGLWNAENPKATLMAWTLAKGIVAIGEAKHGCEGEDANV